MAAPEAPSVAARRWLGGAEKACAEALTTLTPDWPQTCALIAQVHASLAIAEAITRLAELQGERGPV